MDNNHPNKLFECYDFCLLSRGSLWSIFAQIRHRALGPPTNHGLTPSKLAKNGFVRARFARLTTKMTLAAPPATHILSTVRRGTPVDFHLDSTLGLDNTHRTLPRDSNNICIYSMLFRPHS